MNKEIIVNEKSWPEELNHFRQSWNFSSWIERESQSASTSSRIESTDQFSTFIQQLGHYDPSWMVVPESEDDRKTCSDQLRRN